MRWVYKYFFSFPIDGEINAYTEFRYQSTNKFFRMASQQQNFKRYQDEFLSMPAHPQTVLQLPWYNWRLMITGSSSLQYIQGRYNNSIPLLRTGTQ